MRMLPALFLLGCASSHNHPADERVIAMTVIEEPAPISVVAPAPIELETTPARRIYANGTQSVQFLHSTVLRKAPDVAADPVGVIAKGTRAGVTADARAGCGCEERWIEIAPRGWACERVLEPSPQPPTAATSVSLDDDAPPPPIGAYGTVRGKTAVAYANVEDARARDNGRVLVGSNTVRAAGSVTIDGRTFWRTSRGELIEASSIRRMSASAFRGVALTTPELPAWVRTHGKPRDPAITRSRPSPRARSVRKLEARTIVTILEASADAAFVRIGDDEWIARRDLRIASIAPPPPGTGADEKWFDIDLDEQVLVAYEGERPVYATLVSTGKYRHTTPTAITRIASMLQRATMTSNDGDVYSVADVPWTMYYDGNYALHTSYWHDGFGGPRSHGCVNLAPADAHVLYRWSSPDAPAGWTAVYGDADNPGSLVRVRSSTDREPCFRGYARTLRDRATKVASN